MTTALSGKGITEGVKIMTNTVIIAVALFYENDTPKYMVYYSNGGSKIFSKRTLPNTAKSYIKSAKYCQTMTRCLKTEKTWKNEL